MSKWVDDHGEWTLSIAGLKARVRKSIIGEDYGWMIEATAARRLITPISYAPTLDEAKAAAEQALREMHDALVAHFAPVLRWTDARSGAGSVASVGGWFLTASAGCWSLRNMTVLEERDLSWLSPVGYSGDEAQARRDVEAALRSIGVTFRTEGDR